MIDIRELFYGRRKGRTLKPSRQKLLKEFLPKVELTLPKEGFLSPASQFENPYREFWLEFGFGGGEHLAEMAQRHPNVGFIGCEAYINGVASLLTHLHRQNLLNVRVYANDGRPVLRSLSDGALSKIFVLFPDPWPKARHQDRRIISPQTVEEFARILRPGGEVRLASDDQDYIEWMVTCFRDHKAFIPPQGTLDDWQQRPEDWPRTRYEEKTTAQGKTCSYLSFLKLQES